jgi:hypothetical protein
MQSLKVPASVWPESFPAFLHGLPRVDLLHVALWQGLAHRYPQVRKDPT